MNKFLLIICEGKSDQVTIYAPIKEFIKKEGISIQSYITHGDIALKQGATKKSCHTNLKSIIDEYKRQYHLYPSDFFGVFHIIDTDGAFVSGDAYAVVENGYSFDEELGIIYTDDITKSRMINENKKEIYKYLISLDKISNVNYKVLFFSRNLEHILYNLHNCSDEEKKNLSNKFEEYYKDKPKEFYNKMSECGFSVPHNYEDSWDYIMKNSNSIRRGTNFIVLLDLLKQYKN